MRSTLGGSSVTEAMVLVDARIGDGRRIYIIYVRGKIRATEGGCLFRVAVGGSTLYGLFESH